MVLVLPLLGDDADDDNDNEDNDDDDDDCDGTEGNNGGRDDDNTYCSLLTAATAM